MRRAPSLHPFRPRLFDALQGYDRRRFFADLGAGITVGIIALPLALAFGIASGVKPEQGLITAIVAGFLISALGGSQVQIGGPAGAFIVIVYGIVERYGVTNLLVATVGAGVLMVLMGWFKLGVLVRYIPVSIVIGFTNGIAVLIAVSQFRDLMGLDIAKVPSDFFSQMATLAQHIDSFNPQAFAVGSACVLGLAVWPRLFARGTLLPDSLLELQAVRLAAKMPGPIVALITLTFMAWLLALPIDTIGSRFGSLPRGLPSVDFPPLSWEGVRGLTIPIVTIALLGSIEALLCARVADKLGGYKRHDPNQELMAQGVANIVTPFFGGIPATGTIARTVTNVRAGATSPVAGIVHAVALLLVLLVAAPLAEHVPLAALAGILLFVAWNMFEGRQFARLGHFPPGYRTLLVSTFVLTIVFDLTVAVQVGLVMACAFFVLRMGQLFSVKPLRPNGDPPLPEGLVAFELYGSLFFGAVGKIEELPEALPPGTRTVVLDMQRLVLVDSTGLEALQQMHLTLQRRGVALMLASVNDQPLQLMRSTGFEALLGAENIVPSVTDALSTGNR